LKVAIVLKLNVQKIIVNAIYEAKDVLLNVDVINARMETLKVYKKNQGIRENAIRNVEY
jgi:hypothetical protein